MPTNKVKTVEVEVKGKKFTFRFYPVFDDIDNPEQIFCTSCPLYSFCDLIPYPCDVDNEEATFQDFCIQTGDKEYQEVLNEDKLENLVPDFSDALVFTKYVNSDIFQKIVEKDPYVRLSDVIDSVCGPEGYTCPSYNEQHTECTASNGLCILKRIFIKQQQNKE
jgi:hypothetical protein